LQVGFGPMLLYLTQYSKIVLKVINPSMCFSKLAAISSLLISLAGLAVADVQSSSFTYQGQLHQLGQPANGVFDLKFGLYESSDSSSALTEPIQIEDVDVIDGIFFVELDFGASPFTGQSLWLEISVRNGIEETPHSLLSPRQNITATPYAIHAATVSESSINASNIIDGSIGSTQISDFGINTIDIANSAITQAKLADNSVGSPQVIDGSLTAADVDTTQLQRRVSGNCEPGMHIVGINEDGSVNCSDLNVSASISFLPATQPHCGTAIDIMVPDDGLPVILFAECEEEQSGPRDMVLIKCNDLGCQGGDENFVNLNAQFGSIGNSHLKTGLNGHPLVFFDGYSAGLNLMSCADASCSSRDVNRFAYQDSETPVDPNNIEIFAETFFADSIGMDIGADGFPIFVGYSDDYPTGFLDVVKCNDAYCFSDFDNPVTFENGTSLYFIEVPGDGSKYRIQVGSDGFPVVLETGDSFQITRCNDSACAGEDETPRSLSNSIGVNDYILGLDNVPLIAGSAGGLAVIKCNDVSCADDDETVNIVDPDPGNRISVVIAPDGFPVLSYVKSGDLWVAKCNDVACFGGDEKLTLIDGSINTIGSQQTRIAIAADGNPIIIYSDATTGSAKVAHCSTPSCP